MRATLAILTLCALLALAATAQVRDVGEVAAERTVAPVQPTPVPTVLEQGIYPTNGGMT